MSVTSTAFASPVPLFSTLIETVVVSPSWIVNGEADFVRVNIGCFPS